ncbi:MAG: PepSY-like domain-containing protein [Muribaculaceae bacterium]|nr:PepSY-like domain-containing protein [Muribaculaceae bacterium]
MKTNNYYLLLLGVLLFTLSACGDKPVAPAELPQQIQTFVKQTFPGQNISFAQKDCDFLCSHYEITLTDGTQVSFDSDDVWEKIESPMQGVPASVIPAPVATYVNASFPGIGIKKIDKEHNCYEVDLLNGIEVKLNEQGALMEMDD